MPFDPHPAEAPAKTQFQEFADAMLRGCQATQPAIGEWFDCFITPRRACALGAMHLGLGLGPEVGMPPELHSRWVKMTRAYCLKYGHTIAHDNDSGYCTREQIAARIAAL